MQTILDGQVLELSQGASFLDAISLRYPGEDHHNILGIMVSGQIIPLDAVVPPDTTATSVTLATDEGHRIYERSLCYILLLAVSELYPQAHVVFSHSTQLGVYLVIRNLTVTPDVVKSLRLKMKEIIAQDLPYEKQVFTRKQALALVQSRGEMDKADLLQFRPFEYFSMYKCKDLWEYFYGEMPPSTGYTPDFRLNLQLPGIELQVPDANGLRPKSKESFTPKLMRTISESDGWSRILGVANLADLNRMVQNEDTLREFVRVNEALHEKSISDIADEFVNSKATLILIAGPSSSGKTTFANRLKIQLRVRGLNPRKISMDDYYRNRCELPLEEDGKPDLERVDALDVPLFNKNLVALLAGEEVECPQFDFNKQMRSSETIPMKLEPGQPVIIEGIHALNDILTADIPREKKFLIYVSALTTLNMDDHNRIRTTDVRLLRRIVRDSKFRNSSPENTISMWDSVRRGEDRYIFPFQENADIMFNTTLVYELLVLRRIAYPLLRDIPQNSPQSMIVHRLMKFLNYVPYVDIEDEIPLNSILREFVGGCCFYRGEN